MLPSVKSAVYAWVLDAELSASQPQTLTSLTRTKDEVSIVMPEHILSKADDPRAKELQSVADKVETGWACIKVEGPLVFTMVGILKHIASVLAAESISIFVMSTYDTDYVLVKLDTLAASKAGLKNAGYAFTENDTTR